MDAKISCPNCGEGLDVPLSTSFVCPKCGELLVRASTHKLILAHPIKTYLELDEKSKAPGTAEYLDPALPSGGLQLSDRRRKRSAQLASERINQQKKSEHRGFAAGFILSILGGLLLLSTWARAFILGNDWLGFTGIAAGLFLIFLGLAVAIWFYRLMRSADKI